MWFVFTLGLSYFLVFFWTVRQAAQLRPHQLHSRISCSNVLENESLSVVSRRQLRDIICDGFWGYKIDARYVCNSWSALILSLSWLGGWWNSAITPHSKCFFPDLLVYFSDDMNTWNPHPDVWENTKTPWFKPASYRRSSTGLTAFQISDFQNYR